MKCPTCPDATLVMSERQGIEIDYCPSCRGVWLDRGELDKIIERSGADDNAAPPPRPAPAPAAAPVHHAPPPYPQQHGYGYGHPGYKHKRRKSWLEEIFD